MPVRDVPTLRLLVGEPTEMAELQRVLELAPSYAQRVTGLPVGPADAQSTFSLLPPGKTYDDKFVFGIHVGDRMIGCIDLIRGWPVLTSAHVGLLLITEQEQRKGYGRQSLAQLESFVAAWGTCDRLRAGVVRSNATALPFWTSMGFRPTGEVKPYQYASFSSEVIILERQLPNAA